MAEAVFVHPSAVVDEPATIGAGTKIWHFSHVVSGATLGAGCTLGQNVFVAGTATLGDNVKVQNNVSIYDGVTLEDDVFCGPSMVFTNVTQPRSAFPKSGPESYDRTLVKRGATLGANCTLVCGYTVGAWAFIGAGAVVVGDVPDYALVVGNPSRRIGWMCRCGERLPDDGAPPQCAACGRGYRLQGAGLVLERDAA